MTVRKILVILLAVALLALPVVSVSAEDTVSLRIEGAEKTYFSGDVALTEGASVLDLLTKAAEDNGLTLTGADSGYITAVNDEAAGAFGGWDGWMYRVNGIEASVGVGDYKPAAGDKVAFYYGGYPCQVPTLTVEGNLLTFISVDNEYDENYNATQVNAPVVGATVTVGGKTYVTDENGQVDASDLPDGEYTVAIEKKDQSGAPAVIRLAADNASWTKKTAAPAEDTPAGEQPEKTGETGSAALAVCLLAAGSLAALTIGKKRV